MRDSESVTFAGGTLDRAAHLRNDNAAIKSMRLQTDARALVMWRGKPLIERAETPRLAWISTNSDVLRFATEAPIFLGLQNAAPRFAYDISKWEDPAADTASMQQFRDLSENHHAELPETMVFADLRAVMGEFSHDDAGDAATARGIFEWHKYHKFCANCGAKSSVSQAGWQRECPNCGRSHFPRTDPVVIMLVTSGNDVLLGRSPLWPEGMFSLLAGFMEPGEGIEEAVRREVYEETAIGIGHVSYLASQPWPFPASLMIGCHAEATSRDITIDDKEIESAKWVRREDVMESLRGGDPGLMPSRHGSIARFLLDRWLGDMLED